MSKKDLKYNKLRKLLRKQDETLSLTESGDVENPVVKAIWDEQERLQKGTSKDPKRPEGK